MTPKQLQKMIQKVDPERLGAYQQMFDRILLHVIAVNILPKKAIKNTLDFADKVIKKTIDVDSSLRQEFLYGTKEGRVARLLQQPDGEDVRLEHLKTWDVAKSIIKANLFQNIGNNNLDEDDEEDENEE